MTLTVEQQRSIQGLGLAGFRSFVSDLVRQFEFMQSKWLNGVNFPNGGSPSQQGGEYTPPAAYEPPDGPDPVVGEHDPEAQCALHQGGARTCFRWGRRS